MTQFQIKEIQRKVGVEPDGFFGPKSIAATQKYLKSLQPKSNSAPDTSQSSLTAFYGAAGDESQLTNLDVAGLGLKYDGKAVKTVRCHKKVASSLRRVLESLSSTHPEILAEYAGVYNNRPMRGGSTPSLHARGAAIDLDPDNNGNNTSWPTRATMPLEVMEAFAKEGWKPAGSAWGRDAMHFEFTKW